MSKRTPFPRVFWVANIIEILERFAYYGVYFGFGIYMASLGFTRARLGLVQSIFLLVSYGIPVISGSFADRFGFKKVLIVSYVAYLPSILLLIATRTFSGIALTMLSIGLAAGIFKPLIAGTVRATTDSTNKSLGFGIFYQMVNVGGSFGPMVMGNLRATSWNHAFIAGAVCITLMLLITIFFYKEPEREIEGTTLKQKFRDIGTALSDLKFTSFLVLLGLFFWLPFWCFFNLCALYVDASLDTVRLYRSLEGILGASLGGAFSTASEGGARRVLGETISHTGYIIMIFQFLVSRAVERRKPLSTLLFGFALITAGFGVIGYARISVPAFVFLGIFLFAVGEMICSPRIQEYITWIAPKEKAGLYMGMNFLAVMLGGSLSGVTYTTLYGHFSDQGHPEYVWFTLALHTLAGILILLAFIRWAGEFQEQQK
jgi:POT family proton-dependent oligopeptide transporter